MITMEILQIAACLVGIIWCAIKLAPTNVIIHLNLEDRDHHDEKDKGE